MLMAPGQIQPIRGRYLRDDLASASEEARLVLKRATPDASSLALMPAKAHICWWGQHEQS